MTPLRIAMISEHASPLATLGGADGGGQNVYVGELARHLVAAGHTVDVFTRRDAPSQEEVHIAGPRLRVIHVPAGPARTIPKEELLPFMGEFTSWMAEFARHAEYDLIHANFWMSGLVAMRLKAALGTPFAVTFHALGRVRQLHQGAADGFPSCRASIEDQVVAAADRIIAECPQDAADLFEHYHADLAKVVTIPCGVDTASLHPVPRHTARALLGLDDDEPIVP